MEDKRSTSFLDVVAFSLLILVVICATFWLFSFVAFDMKFYWACSIVMVINISGIILRKFWKPSIVEEIGIGLAVIVAVLFLGLYDWAFFAFFCIYCWFILRLFYWVSKLKTAKKMSVCIPAMVTLLVSGVIGYWMTGRMIGL